MSRPTTLPFLPSSPIWGKISLPSSSSNEKGYGYFEHSCVCLDPHLQIHNKTMVGQKHSQQYKVKIPKGILLKSLFGKGIAFECTSNLFQLW